MVIFSSSSGYTWTADIHSIPIYLAHEKLEKRFHLELEMNKTNYRLLFRLVILPFVRSAINLGCWRNSRLRSRALNLENKFIQKCNDLCEIYLKKFSLYEYKVLLLVCFISYCSRRKFIELFSKIADMLKQALFKVTSWAAQKLFHFQNGVFVSYYRNSDKYLYCI